MKPDDLKWLNTLEIINARGSLDLYKVSKSFPKLEAFEIYYSTSVHISVNENFQFPGLKKLIIYDTNLAGSASETITDPIVHDPSGRIPPWAYSVPSYKPPEEILIQDFR